MRFFLLVTFVIILSYCSAQNSNNDTLLSSEFSDVTNDTGDSGKVKDAGFDVEGSVCEPGSIKGCSVDGTGLVVCLKDGSGYEVVKCFTETGKPGKCVDGKCTKCYPGEKICKNDDEVWQCNETGTEFELYQDCNGEETGQICSLGTCTKLCDLSLKWSSYMACDYWGADLDNAFVPGGPEGYYDAQGAQYAIVIGNPSKYPALIKIFKYNLEDKKIEEVLNDSSGNPFPTDPILPDELRIYNLPRRDIDGTTLAPLAYHIVSSVPITVYQFNPLENEEVFSNDASLLLPINVLGNYYIVMTREQTFKTLRSYVTIIATYPGETTVSVTVSAPTLVGPGIPHLEPGDTITKVLKQYDVLNIETDAIGADMTGTIVLSNKPVVVFGGSEASNAPNTNHCGDDGFCEWDGETPCESNADCIEFNTCCADHLEQQLFPVQAWGKKYLCAKSYDRGKEKDVWRVLASQDNTKITTLPIQADIPVLNTGEWFEFESDEHFEIIANKPILVGQFLAAQDAPDPNVNGPQEGDAKIGDPAFILTVPEEQFRKNYVFLAPNNYELDYVSVIAPKDAKVLFDGEEIDPEIWEILGSGEYRVARFQISDGTHHIDSDKPVGVYVYGYDQYVSYGYPAGLDLKSINQVQGTQ